MTFKLVVFDWDGTLMDSEARILDSMQRALAEAGATPRAPDAIREFIGLGLPEAVQGLLPDAPDAVRASVAASYRRHYLGAAGLPSPLFPGVAGVLDELAGLGYLLAVATGKGRMGLDRALRDSGLHGRFRATRCADETRSKPHPQMLQEIMQDVGVGPERTLMIGDTEFDMLLARNAGVGALAVGYGAHRRHRLLGLAPLGCLGDIRELPAWLGGDRRSPAEGDCHPTNELTGTIDAV
jgi:phosphoglycolate phosphatase